MSKFWKYTITFIIEFQIVEKASMKLNNSMRTLL